MFIRSDADKMATSPVPPWLARHAATGETPEPRSRRPVTFFESDGPSDTPVYLRDDLPAGFAFAGPAIVEGFDSTVVIPPSWRAEGA